MSRLPLLGLCMLVLAGCASPPGARTNLAPAAETERQILVTVAQRGELSTALLGAPEGRYRLRRGYGAAPSVERTLRELAREHGILRVEGWPIAALDVYCGIFQVPPDASVDELLRRLSADPRVDLAQRMNVFETLSSRYDDPYVDLQPSVLELDVESAHRVATGRNVTVAVIDSGVDVGHPELRDHVVLSRDLVRSAPMPPEGEVHGTGIAGVIASSANNAEGIVGIAPGVSIAALRACWPTSRGAAAARCSTLSLAQALQLALNLRPDVINLSLNGPYDPLLARLLEHVVSRGIVVVAARPETTGESGGFPALQPGVLVAQSSTPPFGGEAAFPLLVGAPSGEILTTAPAGGYAFLSGTSLAAAHVSGVAALLIEHRPSIGTERIASLLRETATNLPDRATVNACRALARLMELAVCGPTADVVSFGDGSRTID